MGGNYSGNLAQSGEILTGKISYISKNKCELTILASEISYTKFAIIKRICYIKIFALQSGPLRGQTRLVRLEAVQETQAGLWLHRSHGRVGHNRSGKLKCRGRFFHGRHGAARDPNPNSKLDT